MRDVIAVVALAVFLGGCSSHRLTYEEVVEGVRHRPVSEVDRSIAECGSVGEWLEARALHGIVEWDSNDCGEQPVDGAPSYDFPICAVAYFTNCEGEASSVAFAVGTFETGVHGPPEIFWATTGANDARTLCEFAGRNPVCEDPE